MLCGCSTAARVRTKLAEVIAVKDAGKPASVDTHVSGENLPVPKGSKLTITKVEAMPFIPATVNSPEQQAQPAKEITQIELAGPSVLTRNTEVVSAQTGTVDNSVAIRRVEAEESRILLYVAMACMVMAGVFFWLHFPSPAMLCVGSAVVLFLAWKVSNLPPWFYAIAVAAVAIGAGLYFGYTRGEKDAAHPKP